MTKPRILLMDIETLMGKAYVWRLGQQYVGLQQMITPTRTIMVGAKWFGDRSPVIILDERGRGGHKGMISAARDLIAEADAVITYNGDGFDLPWLRGSIVEHGLPPLPPVTSIDLYKTVRGFRFMSKKLAYVAPLLKIGRKVEAGGMQLWVDLDEGKEEAWQRMTVYNRQDVRLLEEGYKTLRPYIPNHPYLSNSGPSTSKIGTCPRCGGGKAQRRGSRRTRTFLVHRLQCLGCGGWYEGLRERVK